uniref:Uncharacterized protein n=1 Tax=Arundo donax TaxID=35708 RepID=A0A0A9A1L9_ARUDO
MELKYLTRMNERLRVQQRMKYTVVYRVRWTAYYATIRRC